MSLFSSFDPYFFTISETAFKDFLTYYNEEVSKGKCSKEISYPVWRKINSLRGSIKVLISPNALYFYSNDDKDKDSSPWRVLKKEESEKSFYSFFFSFFKIKQKDWSNEGTPSMINSFDPYSIKIDSISSIATFTESPISSLEEKVNNLSSQIQDSNSFAQNNSIKENDKNMKNFKFNFGPCTNDNIRMSMYGLAVKNNTDTWVSYNPKSGEIVDVDILNFDGRKFMFKMPVAIKDINVGDIVIHNRVPMFVTAVEGKTIKVVDVRAGERKEILPTKSPFGFNFITKVVSMLGNLEFMNSSASESTPFGNPMAMMLMLGNSEDQVFEVKDMLMMSMMMQNQNGSNMMQNPMMMYFMMKDGDMESDMLPLMMMMGMNQPQKSAE